MRVFVLIVMLSTVYPAAALELPPPFAITLHGQPLYVGKLTAEVALERAGDYLKYSMRTRGELLVHAMEVYDCSVMLVRDGKIQALEHRHTDSSKRSRDALTRFDWTDGTATVTLGNGRKKRVNGLTWPVWDPISLQVQVMADLLNGRLNEQKTYRLIERGKLSDLPLRRYDGRNLHTRHAELRTVGVARTDGESYQLWFAPDYQYLPVQVEMDNVSIELISDPAAASRPAARAGAGVPRC